MRFVFPSWMENVQWRLLCHAIPECLPLYHALRDLADKDIHQTEAREIAELWEKAGRGVDEWERKRTVVRRAGSMRGGRPTAGSHRPVTTFDDSRAAISGSDAAFLLLTVSYDAIVDHVERATSYHLYPFTTMEGQGKPDEILAELKHKPGFLQYSGQKLWENGLPLLGQVYIYGHCEPGVQKMNNDTETKIIDRSELARRLVASGIQTEFSGRIKVFACHSGGSSRRGGMSHDDSADEESMAEGLADAMRARGYRSCEYFGYTESLRYSGSIEKNTGHKYAITTTSTPDNYATSLRNPAYFEEVVKKTLQWNVHTGATRNRRFDEYDMVLEEMKIRDRLAEERNKASAKWYGSNEVRASAVREQF